MALLDPPSAEEARALLEVRQAVEKDLLRGRAPAEIVRDLMKGGVKRVEADDIVARAQRSLLAGRSPREAVPDVPAPPHAPAPPTPPAPSVPAAEAAPVPLVPTRTAVPARRPARPASSPSPSAPPVRRRFGFGSAVLILTAAGAVAAAVLVGPEWMGEQLRLRTERQALAELTAFAETSAALAAANAGAFVPPEVLAAPSRLPPGTPAAPELAAAQRGSYVFRFYGDQPAPDAPVQPAFRAYAYVATPMEPGSRSFALYSYLPDVYARTDGSPPTAEDAVVR